MKRKIDFSKIENWDNLSVEDKLKAIQDYEYDDFQEENSKLKGSFDKTSSELADLKKKYNSKLSEEELKEQERKLQEEELNRKYNELLHERNVANDTIAFKSAGYSDELSKELAELFSKYDIDSNDKTLFFNKVKKFNDDRTKEIQAELVKNAPRPGGFNGSGKTLTKEDILKIKDPTERQEKIAENIELFTN